MRTSFLFSQFEEKSLTTSLVSTKVPMKNKSSNSQVEGNKNKEVEEVTCNNRSKSNEVYQNSFLKSLSTVEKIIIK